LQASVPEKTELLALPREALLELFSHEPSLGYQVFRNVARVIGQRLQLFQTMWIREMQRAIESRSR
jgi:CRP-like cAMP-binding protein